MERPDQGADEAPRLAEGGQRRQHAQPHRPPDPRDEHHPALPQGGSIDMSLTPDLIIGFHFLPAQILLWLDNN